MGQWVEHVLTSDSVVNTITHPNLAYQISKIIHVNGQPVDWAEVSQGITHNTGTQTLDFTDRGGFSGRLVYSYLLTGVAASGVTTQTNGYNISDALPYLRRLGWINPTDDGYDIVDSDNQESLCSRWYNDNSFHPLCQIHYLKDSLPDAEQSDAEFNTKLEQLRDANISSMLNYVFDEPQFVESGLLFDKMERTRLETVANTSKFVGVRFRLAKMDYFLNLLNATLFFDSNVSFTLYLYNEFIGKVAEWDVSALANKQVIVSLNEALRYNDDTTRGGEWFIGYFQDDIGAAKAIRYTACWNDTKTFGAQSIRSTVTGVETFDMQEYEYTHDIFGLNVEYSVTQDLTPLIRRNAYLFDNLQGLMMAAMVMDIVWTSNRSNRNQRIADEVINTIYRELNNLTTADNPTEAGLKSKIRKEIKKVKQAFFNKPKSTVVSLC
jgi:hypothetical protein